MLTLHILENNKNTRREIFKKCYQIFGNFYHMGYKTNRYLSVLTTLNSGAEKNN
jgi:hypothetical protein